MRHILIILIILIVSSCTTKIYNAPFVNSKEIVKLEFGMSKNKVLDVMPEPPLYVKNGNSEVSVWVYNVRTIQVKSDKTSDGTTIPVKASNKIKHQKEIDNLYLTFDINDKLLAWGAEPYDANYVPTYYDCAGVCNGDAYVDECGECIGSSSKEGEAENNNSNDGGSFKLDLKVEGTQEPDGTLIIEGGQ